MRQKYMSIGKEKGRTVEEKEKKRKREKTKKLAEELLGYGVVEE